MDDSEIRRRVLAQFGLKIEPEMSRYLGRRLTSGEATTVAVLGGDARTGVPLCLQIDLQSLRAESNPST